MNAMGGICAYVALTTTALMPQITVMINSAMSMAPNLAPAACRRGADAVVTGAGVVWRRRRAFIVLIAGR